MKNYEPYKRIMRFVLSSFLIMLQTFCYWYIWSTYYSDQMEIPFWRKGHWMMVATYGFLLFVLVKLYGGWKIGYLKVFNLIYSQGLALVLTNCITYLLITLLTKHFQRITPLSAMTLMQISIATIWSVGSLWIYRKIYPPRKLLLVYGCESANHFINKINSRTDRFTVEASVRCLEDTECIETIADRYQGVVLYDVPSSQRNKLLKYCYGKSIRTYTSTKLSDVLLRSAENQHMFDTPLLLLRNTGLTVEQRFFKRLIDITFSLFALLLLSPVMLLISVGIKLQDGGSIFYKQTRLTIRGEKFQVYKFRSMCENAEQDGIARLAGVGDMRITKLGHFIRAVRLDELPQLYNILKGDMSIVGPRPERPEIAEEYCKEIPEFSYRLKTKAGLTGYAQVYGKYNTSAYDKLKLDLIYIQNYNIWLDFEIMFRTIQILFMKESTQGLDAGQTIAVPSQEKM